MKEIQTSITVVGGGLAGVCAAVAAARSGQSVALVGDRPMLGGNSSSEVRIWSRGATGGGNLFSEEMGILGEMKLRNLQVNPDGNALFWDEVLLDTVLAEPNIQLFLNTHANKIEMNDGKVAAVLGDQLFSEQKYRFLSDYYIDSSGDGAVAAAAGLPHRVGKEPSSMFGEQHAPEEASSDTMGNSIILYTKRVDHKVKYIPPRFAYGMDKIKAILNKGGRLVDDKQTGSDYWWLEFGGELDTISDAQMITMELKKLLYGLWDYIKNSGLFPADNLTLEWVGTYGAKRESRRFITDHVLTQTDVFETRQFEDNAFYGGWYLDFHPASGVWDQQNSCTQIPVRTYPMPFRTLFSSGFGNLLLAGRIIGTTHAAFASTRDMNTCALSGQAAGTLAAHCAALGKTPHDVVKNDCLAVQKQLAHDDMLVMDIDCRDGGDLAQSARLSASTSLSELPAERSGELQLTKNSFLCFPAYASTKARRVSLFARGIEEAELCARMFKAVMPSRLNPGTQIGELRVKLAASDMQEVALEIPPMAEDSFVTVIFDRNDKACLHAAAYAPVGFLMGHQWSMDHLYPLMKADIAPLYGPEKVVNGIHRPYGQPNLWVSDAEENPSLQLAWEKPVRVREIRLTLDPDLSREYPSSYADTWNEHHFMAANLGVRPKALADAFVVEALQGAEYREVARIEDNWQRVVVLKLPEAIEASALRIRFASAPDFPYAHLYEVRVY